MTTFNKGDKVKLRPDVLRRHSASVPAHAGYTREQFNWREILDDLEGKPGIIERTFPNSKHVNVLFSYKNTLIGINSTELVKVGGYQIKKMTQEYYVVNKEKLKITRSRRVAEILAGKKKTIYVLPNGAYVVRK